MNMVSLNDARKLLVRAIDTKGPDFVYNPDEAGMNCVYYPDPKQRGHDSPCLIGVVLRLLGLTDAQLAELPQETFSSVESVISTKINITFSPEAIDYLDMAQSAQDSGSTWAKALFKAEKSLL